MSNKKKNSSLKALHSRVRLETLINEYGEKSQDKSEVEKVRDLNFEKYSLFQAVSELDFTAAEILLQKGADPNFKKDYSEMSPCMAAVSKQSIKMLKLLLKYGGDINHATWDVLNVAVSLKETKMLKFLLHYGADFSLPSHPVIISDTPLDKASCWGNITAVKILIEHLKKKSQKERVIMLSQALYNAGFSLRLDIAELLLKEGADPNHNVRNKNTLSVITKLGHSDKSEDVNIIEMLKLLLKYGADLSRPEDVLDGAVIYDDVKLLKFLLRSGADFSLQGEQEGSDRYKGSPLCIAVRLGHIDSLKILIKHLYKKIPEERLIILSQALNVIDPCLECEFIGSTLRKVKPYLRNIISELKGAIMITLMELNQDVDPKILAECGIVKLPSKEEPLINYIKENCQTIDNDFVDGRTIIAFSHKQYKFIVVRNTAKLLLTTSSRVEYRSSLIKSLNITASNEGVTHLRALNEWEDRYEYSTKEVFDAFRETDGPWEAVLKDGLRFIIEKNNNWKAEVPIIKVSITPIEASRVEVTLLLPKEVTRTQVEEFFNNKKAQDTIHRFFNRRAHYDYVLYYCIEDDEPFMMWKNVRDFSEYSFFIHKKTAACVLNLVLKYKLELIDNDTDSKSAYELWKLNDSSLRSQHWTPSVKTYHDKAKANNDDRYFPKIRLS